MTHPNPKGDCSGGLLALRAGGRANQEHCTTLDSDRKSLENAGMPLVTTAYRDNLTQPLYLTGKKTGSYHHGPGH
jgi:hypothetical protein